MKRQTFHPFAALFATALLVGPALAQDPAAEKPSLKIDPNPVTPKPSIVTTFAPIVEKVAPSVVQISTSKMVKPGAAGPG